MTISSFIERCVTELFAIIPRSKPEMKYLTDVKIIAHRGAHDQTQGIVENTMPAFERAQKLGSWGIEFDIHFSKDLEPVVHHDPDFSRLFNRPECIADLSLQEIKKLLPQIPTLEEVVSHFGGRQKLFIEIKTLVSNPQKLIDILSPLKPVRDYYLISLDESILRPLENFPRNCQILVPVQHNTAAFCQLALDKNYAGVLGHFLLLNQNKIHRLQTQQKCYGVGFVESRYSLYREIQRGIPWIFTNRLETIQQCMRELKDDSVH